MRWQRRIWMSLLALCLLAISGCASPSSVDPGTIHLTLWQGINPPPNREVFQRLVDHFNQAHPDIEVESLYVGQPDQQLPKILTAVLGNAPPDILWFGPMFTGQFVELGAIRPIENWLEQTPVKRKLDPSLLDGMRLGGHTWSVPMGTNNVAVFYRPSLFRAAGISQLPQTWDDLRQVAQQLTQDQDGDGRTDQYGMLLPLGKGEWTVFTWLPFLFSAGGDLIRNGQPDLVSEAAIAALEFWQTLLQDGSATVSAPERGYELDDFLTGRVAMQLTGPWTLGQLQQSGVDFGVFPIPKRAQRATVIGGENLFVLKTTPEHEQAALQFLEYVLSADFQTTWSLGTGYLPVNLEVRQSPAYREFIAQQPSLTVFLEQTQWARSRPNIAGYSRLSNSLGRAIEAALLGESSRTALGRAQARPGLPQR